MSEQPQITTLAELAEHKARLAKLEAEVRALTSHIRNADYNALLTEFEANLKAPYSVVREKFNLRFMVGDIVLSRVQRSGDVYIAAETFIQKHAETEALRNAK